MKSVLYPSLATYCASLSREFGQIPDERKAALQQLSRYLQDKRSRQTTSLVVICTHNSRRSHFGQWWLQIAAAYYGVDSIKMYSGGTEATAFHPNAVAALQRAGVAVHMTEEGANPVYAVATSEELPVWKAYSKRYDDSANPTTHFCAMMVCTRADQGCPLVPGAEKRISLPYEDPKAYDGTDWETAQYDMCCRQIAREMFYAMQTSLDGR